MSKEFQKTTKSWTKLEGFSKEFQKNSRYFRNEFWEHFLNSTKRILKTFPQFYETILESLKSNQTEWKLSDHRYTMIAEPNLGE